MLNAEQQYWIDQLASDLAYERVKFSALYSLPNDQVDAKATELKSVLLAAMEPWIVKEEDELEDLKERSLAQRVESEAA